ncbi:MAG: heparan-alpha-glucosaminide N-acetyltransferase domain-containing protein [Elusimicrobiales bacterium]
MKRLDSVDMMRALAIIFMVLCHFPIFLSSPASGWPGLYFFANHAVGDFAAPFFLFLVGMSQVVSSAGQSSGPRTLWRDKAIVRGFSVFILGFGFSFVMQGPGAVFEWDILTLIGFSLIVMRLLTALPDRGFVLLAALAFAAAPPLRGMSGYLGQWGGEMSGASGLPSAISGWIADPANEYAPVFASGAIIKGFFVNGYFPVFPWIGFVFAGAAAGRRISGHDIKGQSRRLMALGVSLSAAACAVAAAAPKIAGADISAGYMTVFSFYPDTPAMAALQLGAALFCFGLLRRLYDGAGRVSSVWANYCRRISRYSLSVYIIHHALMFFPLNAAGWYYGTDYHAGAMTTLSAFLLSVVLLLLLGFALPLWDRRDARYSFEWLLAAISGRFSGTAKERAVSPAKA